MKKHSRYYYTMVYMNPQGQQHELQLETKTFYNELRMAAQVLKQVPAARDIRIKDIQKQTIYQGEK